MTESLNRAGGLMTIGTTKTITLGSPVTTISVANQLINLRKFMPAGGGAANLGGSLDLRTASTSSSLLSRNTGRFNNVLIGQTIAMWFNVNIPGNNLPNSKSFGDFDLRGLECKTTIVTLEPSSNSTCAVPFAGTVTVRTAFPQSVVKALIARKNTTVNELMKMANEALGGTAKTINGASLSDINGALDALISAFHGGKYFDKFEGDILGCVITTPPTSKINVASPVEDAAAVKVEASNAAVVLSAFPNPYIDQVIFNVTVKNAGKGSLVIYNMLGQKVANVFEGNMQANSTQTIRYNVPFAQRKNLVYVFRQNDTTNTGKLINGK